MQFSLFRTFNLHLKRESPQQRFVALEAEDLERPLQMFDSSTLLTMWQTSAPDLNPVYGFPPLLMSIPSIISILLRYILALVAIAFYTLIERKFLGYFQTRKGPNKPVLIGLPVPFADAIKLFTKEQAKPTLANQLPFIVAPVLRLRLALLL